MAPYSFSLDVDVARNVIYIRQQGAAEPEDLERLRAQFEAAVAQMSTGFSIVNDQRFLEPLSDRAFEVAKELVKITNSSSVGRVIRVLPVSVLSKTRLVRALVQARDAYRNIDVTSLEEAERELLR